MHPPTSNLARQGAGMRNRATTSRGVIAVIVIAIAACSGANETAGPELTAAPSTTRPSTTAPTEFVDLPVDDSHAGPSGFPVIGSLERSDDGCWYLALDHGRGAIAFPTDTVAGSTDESVVTPAGVELAVGDLVAGRAREASETDRSWQHIEKLCSGDGLLVLTEIRPAFQPTRQEAADLVASLGDSGFEAYRSCIRPVAVAEDGRVRLTVDSSEWPAVADTVVLPDNRYDVHVAVGEMLTYWECADVVWWYSPEPRIAARFPVVGGTFEQPGADEYDCSTMVTLEIHELVIELPDGEVGFDEPLTLLDPGRNCFP